MALILRINGCDGCNETHELLPLLPTEVTERKIYLCLSYFVTRGRFYEHVVMVCFMRLRGIPYTARNQICTVDRNF